MHEPKGAGVGGVRMSSGSSGTTRVYQIAERLRPELRKCERVRMPNTDHQDDDRQRERQRVETSPDAERAHAEIEAMHVFLAEWLRGSVPNDDDTFAAGFARRFDPGFLLISPDGSLNPLAQVTKRIRSAHGQRPTLTIEIRNVVLRRELGSVLLATYEEWQRHSDASQPDTARLSSVLLQPERVAPGGFAWLHLHECWLPTQL